MASAIHLPHRALRYSEVCAILWNVARPCIRTETRLRGRIQRLQKRGVPEGTRSGRGHPADYSPAAVWHLIFIFELSNFGLAPRAADDLIKASWGGLVGAIERNVGISLTLLPDRDARLHLDVPALAQIVKQHLADEARGATKQ